MSITQGTFSFLPDLTDEEIEAQIEYALDNGWAIIGRVHRRPAPAQRATGRCGSSPMFDLEPDEADVVLREVNACREALPEPLHQGDRLRQLAGPPDDRARRSSSTARRSEPGFRLERQDKADRQMRYTHPSVRAGAAARPPLRQRANGDPA